MENIIILGIASLLADVSSEMILAVLPLFYTSIGIGGAAIGLIEGIAESTTVLLKIYSGWYSDKIGKRKIFVFIGYGLSAISKIFFPIARTERQVLSVRFSDRVGKGLRTSPRDAIIAESVDSALYGRAFSFHRAMDTSGAILGVLLSLILVGYFTYRQIFIIAVIPAVAAALMILLVKEKKAGQKSASFRLSFNTLNNEFKIFVGIAAVFALANFSYAFFILRATDLGAGRRIAIFFYLLYNIVYAVLAVPAGMLSDKISRKYIIPAGYFIFGITCMGFAFAGSILQIGIFFLLYGVFNALIEGVQRAYVAELIDPQIKGTAFGIFHTLVGLAALPGSFVAGLLWQYINPKATFVYGALLAFSAAVAMIILLRNNPSTIAQ